MRIALSRRFFTAIVVRAGRGSPMCTRVLRRATTESQRGTSEVSAKRPTAVGETLHAPYPVCYTLDGIGNGWSAFLEGEKGLFVDP